MWYIIINIINIYIYLSNTYIYITDMVLKNLTSSDEEIKLAIQKDLEVGLMEIKNIAINYKQHLKNDKLQEQWIKTQLYININIINLYKNIFNNFILFCKLWYLQ